MDSENIRSYNSGKGASKFDFAHIGVVGIYDYLSFWESLEKIYRSNQNDSSLNDVVAISSMLDKGIKFKYFEILEWLDIGNLKSFEYAKNNINKLGI